MAVYYYTPCFEGQFIDPETDLPVGSPVRQPGKDTGSGPELADLPSGMRVLKYDGAETRCVVKVPHGTNPLPGWLLKNSGEVLTDYPGLSGVE